MKNSFNILLLSIFCSLLTLTSTSNLKEESTEIANEMKTELIKLNSQQELNTIPQYSEAPFKDTILEEINGEVNMSEKIFYSKISLRNKIATEVDAGNVLSSANLRTKKFIDTKIQIPRVMAKLEMEMYLQFFCFKPESTDILYDIVLELYLGEILVSEKTFIVRKTHSFCQSVYLEGTLFNIPAGTYPVYFKVKTSITNSATLFFKYSNSFKSNYNPSGTDASYIYYTTDNAQYLNTEVGYLELVGIPLSS